MLRNEGLTLTVGHVVLVVLVGTAVLSLETPQRETLIPFATVIMLWLQVWLPLSVFPLLRWPFAKTYTDVMNLFVLTCLLFIFSLASSMWSAYPDLVFQRSLMVFVPLLLIALMVWADPRPAETFILVGQCVVLFASALSALGILLFVVGSEAQASGGLIQSLSVGPITIAQRVYGIPPFLRISSLTGNPNRLAMWLSMSIPITIYLLHIRRVRQLFGGLALLVQIFALILTFSRAGLGATLVALTFYYYWSPSNLKMRLIRILAGAAIIVLVGVGVLTVNRVFGESERLTIDLNDRGVAWALLGDAFLDQPIVGIGFGVSYESSLEPYGVVITSHNAHLQTLVEIGIFGYGIVLVMWLTSLRTGLLGISAARSREQRQGLVVAAAILAALFVHQFFEGSLLRYGFQTLFWGYVMFLAVHPRMRMV